MSCSTAVTNLMDVEVSANVIFVKRKVAAATTYTNLKRSACTLVV